MGKMTRRGFMGYAPALGVASLASARSGLCGTSRGSTVFRGLRVAAFSCNVTPPIGSPLEMCNPPVATSVDGRLLAKGVILSDGGNLCVLCAFDYCELRTGAHDLFRRKIANALGVNELQVEVHCVHQHDAPFYDVNADMLLDLAPAPPHLGDPKFTETASDRVGAEVRAALGRMQPCTHVGWGKGKVEKFASNRRVRMADGSIGVRYSTCTDPLLIAAPEGLIDPWLRTVTFFNQDRPLVRLHYYASHPQSYYGKGHMNPDTAGLARERLEKEEGVPQVYFNGCAGNVAVGKYNNGSPELRVQLAERLYQGMKASIVSTLKTRCAGLSRKGAEVRFPLRTEREFSEQHFRSVLVDVAQPYHERTKAAMGLAWYERLKLWPSVDMSCYRIGPVSILSLPGEAFVEYQLYAQSLRTASFIATAAYGELGPGYVCTDKALSEGGYEPTESFAGAGTEENLKSAIRELLA